MDNLIAQGKAEPMIVVMPYGYMMNGTPMPSSMEAAEMYTVFSEEMVKCVIPFIESSFRVRTDREGRAIAGFPEEEVSLCLLRFLIWINLPGWHHTVLILLRK